jgi:protein subunit release factor A
VRDTIRRRLERVADRRDELERMLADPEALGGSTRFRELAVEFARIDPIAQALARLAGRERELAAARAMAADPDAGLRALAEQEIAALERAVASDEAALQRMLVPVDPLDDHNVFLEIRAAAGGDEAAIFAGDLQRMYSRYAERRGWSVEPVSQSRGEHGGYREVVSRIAGRGVYAKLKFESGTHRVQRVPATESQGRIHLHRRGAAGDRGGRERRDQPRGAACRHLPLLRRGRPARQQDGLRGTHHAPADGNRRRMPGRALPAQESRARDGAAARTAARRRT